MNIKKFVVWSKLPVGWLTSVPGELSTHRQDAYEFAEDDERLRSVRRVRENFQIYPVHP